MPATQARSASLASDPVTRFFSVLAQPGHLATFEGESATLRFDVLDGERVDRWHLNVVNGDVTVTRRNSPADVVVRIQRPDVEAIVTVAPITSETVMAERRAS